MTKNWKSAAAFALAAAIVGGGANSAHAQNAPQFAALPNSETPINVRVPRGERVTLSGDATRIIAANDDVARGLFSDGRPVLEGVATGTTLVEVYGRDNSRRLYSVQVEEPLTTTRNSAKTAISQTPSASTRASSRPRFAAANEAPRAGAIVTPVAPGASKVVTQETPTVIAATGAPISALPNNDASTRDLPNVERSGLVVSMRVAPSGDNPLQALCTITYRNGGSAASRGVMLHLGLADSVSYVKGTATGKPAYDASARELNWNLGELAPNQTGRVMLRLEPIDRKPAPFQVVATIEDASGVSILSNAVNYSFSSAPLLTVFALPDRFLAGRTGTVLRDVKGLENQRAIDRLQTMGVVEGRERGLYYPAANTERAEYAVLTLKGLNLKDLRDATAIKFVLGRRSNVTVKILRSNGQVAQTLISNKAFPVGEQTVVWDGRIGNGFAPPGSYTYECTARDASTSETTVLRGQITIVPQTPLDPVGTSSFTDVSAKDWFSGYLAVAEKQNLMIGYPDKTFRPRRSINRVEATAVVVRALGLEDVARRANVQDVGFLDEQNIPAWAKAYVYVATTVARTRTGKLMIGYPSNFYLPMKALRRDEAALIVQRLIDKETNRRIAVSGAMVPGATVSINGRTVEADDSGKFSFVIDQNTAQPTTVAVIGPGM